MAIAICPDEAAVDSAWKASGAVTDESTIIGAAVHDGRTEKMEK